MPFYLNVPSMGSTDNDSPTVLRTELEEQASSWEQCHRPQLEEPEHDQPQHIGSAQALLPCDEGVFRLRHLRV